MTIIRKLKGAQAHLFAKICEHYSQTAEDDCNDCPPEIPIFSRLSPHQRIHLVREVFVADERHMTASGGTATADLLLHVISRDHGQDLSADVADQLVYSAVRDATASQRASLQARHAMRNKHLAAAIKMMRDNLETPMPPGVIAGDLGISVRQLERLFGKYLNTSPKKYFVELRLERARNLLVQTEMSVADVAFACGYESIGHFSRTYRLAFGVTPMMQRGRLD